MLPFEPAVLLLLSIHLSCFCKIHYIYLTAMELFRCSFSYLSAFGKLCFSRDLSFSFKFSNLLTQLLRTSSDYFNVLSYPLDGVLCACFFFFIVLVVSSLSFFTSISKASFSFHRSSISFLFH